MSATEHATLPRPESSPLALKLLECLKKFDILHIEGLYTITRLNFTFKLPQEFGDMIPVMGWK